jgi:hypothetical protein
MLTIVILLEILAMIVESVKSCFKRKKGAVKPGPHYTKKGSNESNEGLRANSKPDVKIKIKSKFSKVKRGRTTKGLTLVDQLKRKRTIRGKSSRAIAGKGSTDRSRLLKKGYSKVSVTGANKLNSKNSKFVSSDIEEEDNQLKHIVSFTRSKRKITTRKLLMPKINTNSQQKFNKSWGNSLNLLSDPKNLGQKRKSGSQRRMKIRKTVKISDFSKSKRNIKSLTVMEGRKNISKSSEIRRN